METLSWKQPPRRFTPFLVWFAVCAVIIGSHWKPLFQEAHYEAGDFAANALQIRSAKAFHEIHGNYSRFRFHHPGPAFFYAYAAGEILLHDALKVVPSPYNAHVIIGILVQALFFTWAIAIVASHVRRPLLVPLLLLFGAIHFGTVNFFINDTAFSSIWPPNVLLFPFLCLLVAGASVAAGKPNNVIPLVLASCMLVHGHVAQPLFVGSLALLAYVGLPWSESDSANKSPWRAFKLAPRSHLIAGAIILLFLVPIALDALRGEESNLHLIVKHFSTNAEDHKTLAQSAFYLATFFFYIPNPEKYCDTLTVASFEFLRTGWPFLVLWTVIGITLALLLRYDRRKRSLEEPRFSWWLAIFFISALALTLGWGKMQSSNMYGFNSYFNFAILFLPWILLAIALASLPQFSRTRLLPVITFFVSLPVLAFGSRNFRWNSDFPTWQRHTKELHEAVRKTALQDQQVLPTKFLWFEDADWPDAIRVALSLDRLGYGFIVPHEWTFMFGSNRGRALSEVVSRGEIPLWKIGTASSNMKWLSAFPPEIDPRRGEIIFSGDGMNAAGFVVSGWDLNEPFAWSTAATALIRFTPQHAESDVRIECELFPWEGTKQVSVSFNDGPTQSYRATERNTFILEVPREVWNRHALAFLTFSFPDAVSPRALGVSADPRNLSCGFVRIRFRSDHTTTPSRP